MHCARLTLLCCVGLALFLTLGPGAVRAATYYVDQTAGVDTNNGTSPATPWKNAPGMAAYSGSGSIAAGDTVFFDSADTWLVTGTQGLYLVGGATYIGNTWPSAGRAILRANGTLTTGIVRFRDHATQETTIRGFDLDGNSQVTTGVDINGQQAASALTGATKRMDNLIVRNTFSNQSLSQYRYGIHVSDHAGAAGAVANVEILNSVVHDASRECIAIYPGDESAANQVSNVLVRGNEVYNSSTDPNYSDGSGLVAKGNVQNVVFEYNYVHDTIAASGIFINGNQDNHFGTGPVVEVRYNLVVLTSTRGAILIYDDGTGAGDPKTVNVYGNLVVITGGGPSFQIAQILNSNTVRIYNNTFVTGGISLAPTGGGTFPVLEVRNNIVYTPNSQPLIDNPIRITAHSNNLYFRSTGTALVTSGGTTYTSADLTTYEATGLSSNPLFTNATSVPTGFTGTYGTDLHPNTTGLELQAGSPARNVGLTLGSPYVQSINSVARPSGSAFDLGAYEMPDVGSPPRLLRVLR